MMSDVIKSWSTTNTYQIEIIHENLILDLLQAMQHQFHIGAESCWRVTCEPTGS